MTPQGAPTTVNQVNDLLISFTATNGIPIGGLIKVQFPKWNPTAPLSE